jgi:hypothetical protein
MSPFPTPPPDVARLQETTEPGSRTEKFGRVIIALDTAAGSAHEAGEESYADYVEGELIPFAEAERERAAAEEGLTPLLRWEESLFRK